MSKKLLKALAMATMMTAMLVVSALPAAAAQTTVYAPPQEGLGANGATLSCSGAPFSLPGTCNPTQIEPPANMMCGDIPTTVATTVSGKPTLLRAFVCHTPTPDQIPKWGASLDDHPH